MTLSIIYQGTETTVDEGDTVLIGSDAASTIRIVRPGISRRHAVVSFDGNAWKVEDAGSRNGVFVDGQRAQTLIIEEPTTVYLGHPSDGEVVSFNPIQIEADADASSTSDDEKSIQAEIDEFVISDEPKPEPASSRTRASQSSTAVAPTRVQPAQGTGASDADIAALTSALRDQISSVKGLTWSVWAMIAVTAVLAVMTLFVGILSN